MRHLPILWSCFFFTLFYQSHVFALVSVSASQGQRHGALNFATTTTQSQTKSHDTSVKLTVDPLPLIPLGLEVAKLQHTLELSAQEHTLSAGHLNGYGLGLEAWIPIFPFVTPYARLMKQAGELRAEYDSSLLSYAGSTRVDYLYHSEEASLGIRYAPVALPLVNVSVFLEYIYSQHHFMFNNFADAAILASPEKQLLQEEMGWQSSGIALGLKVGI
ncbi:MAG: hypothetical protein OXT67_04370 [Zetaproteobacteria bacterium]|nr:hypothetical protein [Zetaproteobacteria bacterium]